MKRVRGVMCGVAALSGGCASMAPVENPVLVRPPADGGAENPILVAPGAPTAATYAEVYERVIDVVDDYFEIKPTSRYAGHIETKPRTAPGFEQPWMAGSPDARERLLATFQSIRHVAVIDIWAGERGGYRVYVEVYKELEDLTRPTRAAGGPSVFVEQATVDRQAELVGGSVTSSRQWIPAGRDYAFEQRLLKRIREAGPCQ